MTTELSPLAPVRLIRGRLLQIFPEGAPNRNYCTREIAARTIFVMLYVGAVAGHDRWARPNQVTRMTDKQAGNSGLDDRLAWAKESLKPEKGAVSGRWYAVDTREPIRDETLRDGLVPTGAVTVREGLPTTSAKPRYALSKSFAALFDPQLEGKRLAEKMAEWRDEHLSAGALARIKIMQKGAVASETGVMITFPSGETQRMAAGPSSTISKAVIEVFAHRFLQDPGVIFLSESGNKIIARHDQLAQSIGLRIDPERNLPDIILVDLGPRHPLLVFVEVVATDGPISEGRKTALMTLATDAGFGAEHVAFVTAYQDRDRPAFKKTISSLAWQSFAWFASEPNHIITLRKGGGEKRDRLSELLQ